MEHYTVRIKELLPQTVVWIKVPIMGQGRGWGIKRYNCQIQ
jgi:hypothetical protein